MPRPAGESLQEGCWAWDRVQSSVLRHAALQECNGEKRENGNESKERLEIVSIHDVRRTGRKSEINKRRSVVREGGEGERQKPLKGKWRSFAVASCNTLKNEPTAKNSGGKFVK